MKSPVVRAAAVVVLVAAGMSVHQPQAALAVHGPGPECTVDWWITYGWKYRSTWTFWHNTASYIGGVPNLRAAMNAGPGGWNAIRTSCTRYGTPWAAFVDYGTNTRTPGAVDGYNTIGWENFTTPPADEPCRAVLLANATAAGYFCGAVLPGHGLYEFGVMANAAIGPWTSNLSNTGISVQGLFTHEFGHATGLDHTPTELGGCSQWDWGYSMTMYPCFNSLAAYTLGRGDMIGSQTARP